MRAQFTFAVVALFLITAAASGAAEGPSLSVDDPLVTESDTGTRTAVFTVRLSAPADGPVSVDYVTADDSAVAPGDYAAAAGTVTFAPGETLRQVTMAVAGDTLDEPHESFVLNLSNPSGAVFGDARGIATILDNDPLVSLSIDDVSASEASGSAGFTVSLSPASGKVVTVAYATADGSAGAPADYAAAAGTLIFMPGQSAKTVVVPLEDDDLVEPDETFTVTLSSAVSGLLGDAQGVGTITSDDTPPPPPPGEDPPPPPGEDPPPPPPEEPPGEEPPGPPPAPEPNQAPDCSAVAPSTAQLWAPNHKFRPVYLDGASDPDGDPLEYEVEGVTQDEPIGKGPDAKPGERGLWLRAERVGHGDGRVYRIAYIARDDHGNSCGGLELVTVPHDRRHAQVADSGGSWDSFGP